MLLNTRDKTRRKSKSSVVITFLSTIREESVISGKNDMIDNRVALEKLFLTGVCSSCGTKKKKVKLMRIATEENLLSFSFFACFVN